MLRLRVHNKQMKRQNYLCVFGGQYNHTFKYIYLKKIVMRNIVHVLCT